MVVNKIAEIVKELQADLGRRYMKQGAAIKATWRSFDQDQRLMCITLLAARAKLVHADNCLSKAIFTDLLFCLKTPELIKPDSESLFDLIEYRVTRSLFEQFTGEPGGRTGDRWVVERIERECKCRFRYTGEGKKLFYFAPNDRYGELVKASTGAEATGGQSALFTEKQSLLSYHAGLTILLSQDFAFVFLLQIVDYILQEGSQNQSSKETASHSNTLADLASLSLKSQPHEVSLKDMIATAQDRRESMEQYPSLMRSEPSVFTHMVEFWFCSRPDMVPDGKGRCTLAICDKHISPAVFRSVQECIKTAAIWQYLACLLELLEKAPPSERASRALVLQEIANICNFEFLRTKEKFQRAIYCTLGLGHFRRHDKDFDQYENPRVTMKRAPEDLKKTDPQLYYMLCLCRPRTNASNAVQWLEKLSDLQARYPKERKKLEEWVVTSLFELALIVGFSQDLATVGAFPQFSRKKGQMYITKTHELEAKLSKLKASIDLREFAAPIDHLKEPGMAEATLTTLDNFVVEKAGMKMELLYQNIVEDCLVELQKLCEQAEVESILPQQMDWSPKNPDMTHKVVEKVQERPPKLKTRPAHSSALKPTISMESSEDDRQEAHTTSGHTLKVSAVTAQTFSLLFDKSRSRGTVSWTAFESAMADLGFSVIPKFGSVYTFLPPAWMSASKSFTIHRPHQARIEGYLVPIFARRLKRAYGWTDKTFEVV